MEELTIPNTVIVHMADNEKSERKEEKEHHQDVEELATWRKKIEMIGIDIKGLDRENETRLDSC